MSLLDDADDDVDDVDDAASPHVAFVFFSVTPPSSLSVPSLLTCLCTPGAEEEEEEEEEEKEEEEEEQEEEVEEDLMYILVGAVVGDLLVVVLVGALLQRRISCTCPCSLSYSGASPTAEDLMYMRIHT
jgi:hypothetical protein